MAESPLLKKFRAKAREFSSRAVDELLDGEGRADPVGMAVRGLQRGRREFDETGGRLLSAMGFATVEDAERVGRRIGRLRKRLQRLVDDLADEG